MKRRPAMPALQPAEDRLTTAADWFFRLRDPDISAHEVAQWLAWRDDCEENQQAFAKVKALWHQSGDLEPRLPDPAAMTADRYEGTVAVADWNRTGRQAAVPARPVARSSVWTPFAAAAMVVLAVLTWFWLPGDRAYEQIIEVAEAGNHEFVLTDGSVVTAAGGSRLKVRFTGARRDIVLERGEAFFEVSKDALRPFTVRALDALVTAVGTAFNVSAANDTVRVAVAEGVVSIDRRQRRSDRLRTGRDGVAVDFFSLKAGYLATLSPRMSVAMVEPVDTKRLTAWVRGSIQFVDQPLAQVVGEINRYSSVPVELRGDNLSGLRYTGTVVAGRTDEWLRGLSDIFPVRVEGNAAEGFVITTVAMRTAGTEPGQVH